MVRMDYYTIIGKDPGLFSAHIKNVLKYAGMPREEWKFHTIIYRNRKIAQATTDSLVEICKANDISYVFYDEPTPSFLHNLYACWNLGYSLGDSPLTLRAGSDQFFSPNSFKSIVEAYEQYGREVVLQMHTVESILSPQSRHFVRDYGSAHIDFKEEEFNKFAAEMSRPGVYDINSALSIWGKPTSFSNSFSNAHNRVDGCTWLMSKAAFQKFGPMIPINQRGITGDVSMHDSMELSGVPMRLVGDTWTYHLVRGESKDVYQ